MRSLQAMAGAVLALALVLVAVVAAPPPGQAASKVVPSDVHARVSQEGWARVIVELHLPGGPYVPEGWLAPIAAAAQRRDIAATVATVLARLTPGPGGHRVVRTYTAAPVVALEIGPAGLADLQAAAFWVKRVVLDTPRRPSLLQSVPLVRADYAWANNFDGTGQIVAIIDTGVQASHPFLAGKVVEEACYSSTVQGRSVALCPNGQSQQTGPGAGANCAIAGCEHGTAVAGIAAGNGAGAGVQFSGVAKGAHIMAVQVFSRFDGAADCAPFLPPCVMAWDSDIVAGVERVYALRGTRSFAAVNLSLGGGSFTTACDDLFPAYKAQVDTLRSVGIATVVAAGNDGFTNALETPGCISSAVSVGATTKSDELASYSNVSSFVSLLAPGGSINSSAVGGGFSVTEGTSFATPHVAGAWAVLKQAQPGASVAQVLSALQSTGVAIADRRAGGSVTKPRIVVSDAVAFLNPARITDLTADKAAPQAPGTTITFTATSTGGIAPREFKWWVWTGAAWSVARDWGVGNTFAWTPATANAGYQVAVWVRSAGTSGATLEDGRAMSFAIETPHLTVALAADKAAPQGVGTTVTFTATPTGGVAPHRYKWWLRTGGGWVVLRDWAVSNTYAWTPGTADPNYQVAVWAQSAATPPDTFEAGTTIAFPISAATITGLTADKAPPQPPGTSITFTATATGGTTPYQYKWWVWTGTAWTLLQDWTASSTYAWAPSTASPAYQVAVWVRSAGTLPGAYEDGRAIAFAIQAPPLTVGLAADKAAPQPPGTAITFTAAPAGGTPPYQYKWWLFNGGSWVVLRDWAASNTYAWTPLSADANYKIAVWSHSAGTPADAYEAGTAVAFPISTATITALTADKASPQPPGTSITFTATTTGGAAPYQYKWWLWTGTAWALLQDWTASSTYAWTPATSAPYQVAVWVRSAGTSPSAYEDGRAMAFAIQAPPLSVALTADKAAPQAAGTEITFTAAPSGGTAPYQYKWWVFTGGAWAVLREWLPSNTYAWTPLTADANYMIAVWAHSAGTPEGLYEAGAALAFPIPP